MIRKCHQSEFAVILEIINDGARAYQGVIPADRWHDPYMSKDELEKQIKEAVIFWAYENGDNIQGVMGIQRKQDVTLIRHAYVRSQVQRQGVGSMLLSALYQGGDHPFLVGTWADAIWAIRFYQKHGFRLVSLDQVSVLLNRYWSIPKRQVETSVVLANNKWFEDNRKTKF